MFGMVVGSYAGSYLPSFWGVDSFSFTSIFASALGGFLGIWIMYRIVS